jgi:hypothetical protein
MGRQGWVRDACTAVGIEGSLYVYVRLEVRNAA